MGRKGRRGMSDLLTLAGIIGAICLVLVVMGALADCITDWSRNEARKARGYQDPE